MRTHRWSSPPELLLTAWVATAGAVGWSLLAGDATARLMAGVTTAVLGAGALFGTLTRPRLAADEHGITIRGPFGSRDYPWTAVLAMRVARTQRLGRTVAVLEVDTAQPDGTQRLDLFGRIDLGRDVADVAGTLFSVAPDRLVDTRATPSDDGG